MPLFYHLIMWLQGHGVPQWKTALQTTFTTGGPSRAQITWDAPGAITACHSAGIYADRLPAASHSFSWGWASRNGKSRSPAPPSPRFTRKQECVIAHVNTVVRTTPWDASAKHMQIVICFSKRVNRLWQALQLSVMTNRLRDTTGIFEAVVSQRENHF